MSNEEVHPLDEALSDVNKILRIRGLRERVNKVKKESLARIERVKFEEAEKMQKVISDMADELEAEPTDLLDAEADLPSKYLEALDPDVRLLDELARAFHRHTHNEKTKMNKDPLLVERVAQAIIDFFKETQGKAKYARRIISEKAGCTLPEVEQMDRCIGAYLTYSYLYYEGQELGWDRKHGLVFVEQKGE